MPNNPTARVTVAPEKTDVTKFLRSHFYRNGAALNRMRLRLTSRREICEAEGLEFTAQDRSDEQWVNQ